MVVWLEIEFSVIDKGGTRKEGGRGGLVREELLRLLALWPLCVWVYLHCYWRMLVSGISGG
jgi:hypothetical protein